MLTLCRVSRRNRNVKNFVVVKNGRRRPTVWTDLAKFRHFGNISKVFGMCLRVYLHWAKNVKHIWLNFSAVVTKFVFLDLIHKINLRQHHLINSIWQTTYFVRLQTCTLKMTDHWGTKPLILWKLFQNSVVSLDRSPSYNCYSHILAGTPAHPW